MSELLAFLIKEIPPAISSIQKIVANAPAAIDSAKELTGFVQRTIETIRSTDAPLTDEQEAELDRADAEMAKLPWWQSQDEKSDQ